MGKGVGSQGQVFYSNGRMRPGRQGGKVDKGEKEQQSIKTHQELIIYQN
jgi:hypothetical protein